MEHEKPINSPSNASYGRELKVRKNVINWLTSNLAKKGSTKTALADACGVRKQSVSNWFVDGRVKAANIIAAATFFGVEPPYDLMGSGTAEFSDPMSYPWRPEFRELVGKLVRDNDKRGSVYTKKAKALCDVYDAMSYVDVEDSLRRSYVSEINDAVRVKHVAFADDGESSVVRQAGEYIYLTKDDSQVFVFPSSPSDEDIVTEAIISLSQVFDNEKEKVAYVAGIGSTNEKLLGNMSVKLIEM